MGACGLQSKFKHALANMTRMTLKQQLGWKQQQFLSATPVFQLALVAESVPRLVRVRGILNLKDICVSSA